VYRKFSDVSSFEDEIRKLVPVAPGAV